MNEAINSPILQSMFLLMLAFFFGLVVGLGCACTKWLYDIEAPWRAIIQAYLEAQCAARNAPMRVADPEAKPGRVYKPTIAVEESGDE